MDGLQIGNYAVHLEISVLRGLRCVGIEAVGCEHVWCLLPIVSHRWHPLGAVVNAHLDLSGVM